MKYRVYQKTKLDKVEKYNAKLQKHYDDTHVTGTPWIISCVITTPLDRYAATLIGEDYPENNGDDGVVDTLEPGIIEG
jgi:hypothetical protein